MEATVGLSGEVATAPVCEALGLSRAVLEGLDAALIGSQRDLLSTVGSA